MYNLGASVPLVFLKDVGIAIIYSEVDAEVMIVQIDTSTLKFVSALIGIVKA